MSILIVVDIECSIDNSTIIELVFASINGLSACVRMNDKFGKLLHDIGSYRAGP